MHVDGMSFNCLSMSLYNDLCSCHVRMSHDLCI